MTQASQFSLPYFQLDMSRLRAGLPADPAGLDRLNRAWADFKAKTAMHGFYDWPNTAPKVTDALRQRADELRRNFVGALCFGIGGSYLGPACIQAAAADGAFPITWVANGDPAAIEAAKRHATTHKLATVVISKSGQTTETLSAFFHLSRYLDPSGFTVITDPQNGELRRLARQEGWTAFDLPENIGGRYSVLTSVGLLPTYLAGLPAERLIQGASAMRQTLEAASPENNPALHLAYAMHAWDTQAHHAISVLMPYDSRLALFAHWYVQLWAESLGKNGRGPTPMAALGTQDHHSLLQLFKQGPPDKVLGFITVKDTGPHNRVGKPAFKISDQLSYLCGHDFGTLNRLAHKATEQSLARSKVPSYHIELTTLDLETLGALFFFYETACALAGEFYGVNAFDQPGVEESKQLLREALHEIKTGV